MRRGGFTLVELLIGGAVLATIAFGALIGIIRIAGFVDMRGELMEVDGFCWDLAWTLFNEDGGGLKELMAFDEARAAALRESGYEPPFPVRPAEGPAALEISGEVNLKLDDGRWAFLPNLQYPGSPPVCYITLSNAYDAVTGAYDDKNGVFIDVNLEWGPQGHRRILSRRADTPADAIVFDQPIRIFRSYVVSRKPVHR